ncbi:uncharacterized protein VTP21DRAFT_3047 [Calcarisporiella thermophila]|uniref:uncharacterized protein n=1 Tax=Calcarisporiella thermophila TaxID=911321 RepID=UPI003744093A
MHPTPKSPLLPHQNVYNAHQSPPITPPTPSPSSDTPSHFTLEIVRNWTEEQVAQWLRERGFGTRDRDFIENGVTGKVLLDVDYTFLKQLEIPTVGERVRILTAVRSLRRECTSLRSDAKKLIPFHDTTDCNTTPLPPRPAGPTVSTSTVKREKPLPSVHRSHSLTRLLSRSDSKRKANTSGNAQSVIEPTSPKGVATKRSSAEGDIMSLESVKQRCVRVIGDDGQTRVVNVSDVSDAKSILAKVLRKFGICDDETDKYSIFVNSSETGAPRIIREDELVDICKSVDRPERDRLILRKKHLFVTHSEFRRLGSANYPNSHPYRRLPSPNTNSSPVQAAPASSMPLSPRSLNRMMGGFRWGKNDAGKSEAVKGGTTGTNGGLSMEDGAADNGSNNNNAGAVAYVTSVDADEADHLRPTFIGERPPSELISSNLAEFFPGHRKDILEEANRNSILRKSALFNGLGIEGENQTTQPQATVWHKVCESEEEENLQKANMDTPSPSTSGNEGSMQLPPDLVETVEDVSPDGKGISSLENDSIEEKKNDTNPKNLSLASTLVDISSEHKSEEETEENSHSNNAPLKWMKGALIGRGTFSDVFLGLNALSGELMAVKQVELPNANSNSVKRKRSMLDALQREISLLQHLHHENIVQYLGSSCDDSHLYIFLEYVPGGSVAGLLVDYGPFEEPLVRSFVKQILQGLNYLHERDIIHRDIKGANTLVDNKGRVKISDFGISKKMEDDLISVSGASRPSLQGSAFWMAPEAVKQTQYTCKADIWSLGCLVIEMFSGVHPWPTCTQMQAIFKIGSYTAPEIPPEISEEARDFLGQTFKINYEERPFARELLHHIFVSQA